MSVRLYTNNASDTLNGAIGAGDTTITLNDASEFPVPGAGEIAYATIDDNTNVEIITYTGVSTNDLTGVTRGVDGTSGTAFANATAVEVRATASSFEDVLQADETPELQGPLDCSNSGVYIGFGGSSSNTAYSVTNNAGVPRIYGAANFYWGFGSGLYCQAGTSFNRWEFTNDSNRFRMYTNNSERFSINDSGMQLGAMNARVTTILDENDMATDSATALSTQQSIKAYTDSILVSEQIISTAVTSLTFSSLDSDTDAFYFLELSKDPSVACSWNLHVNGNTTVTNYYTQSLFANGTTVSGARLNNSNVIFSGTGGGGSYAQVYCTVLDNAYFAFTSVHGRNAGGTSPELQNFGGGSNFTLTNITSLTLTADASNGIGVGSVIRLYKGVR